MAEIGLGPAPEVPRRWADGASGVLSLPSLYIHGAEVNSIREKEVSPPTVPGTQNYWKLQEGLILTEKNLTGFQMLSLKT